MNVVITGAAGRMGFALIGAIGNNESLNLTGALERIGHKEVGNEIVFADFKDSIFITDNPEIALQNADVVIDFTIPHATLALLDECVARKIAMVIGTTGFTVDEEAKIMAASKHIPIVKSGNMSLGVNILALLVEQAAAKLGADYDIEILEMHHKRKVDAPSGTALMLGEAAAKGRAINLAQNSVRVRDGHTGAREQGTIGFATLRGGTVIGDHDVMFAGTAERIVLSHKAESRDMFAAGAVKAASWLKGKPAGLYTMRDVLGI